MRRISLIVLTAGISVFMTGPSSALAQNSCPKDPDGLKQYFIDHIVQQRHAVASMKSTIIYDENGDPDPVIYERTIDASGKVTYKALSERPLPRAVKHEIDNDQKTTPEEKVKMEFTDANYNIQFDSQENGLFRYKLSPLKKRRGLIDGYLYIDSKTCTPTKIMGKVETGVWKVSATTDIDFQTVKGIYAFKNVSFNYDLFGFKGVLTNEVSYKPEDVVLRNGNDDEKPLTADNSSAGK